MRAAILETVREQPGQHFRAVQREADCSTNTLNHHLRHCDRVVDADIRGYRRLYPDDVSDDLYSPLAAMNHDTRGPIIALLHNRPDASFSEVVDIVEKAASTVSHHLDVLSTAELVAVDARGRSRYYRTTAVTDDAIGAYGPSVLDRMADNFIDMWG